MRHRAPLALLLALLALSSCHPSAPRVIAPDVVADEKSAFVIVDAISLYSLSGDALTFKESVPLGEKLSLQGKRTSVTQAGRKRDFLDVKRSSGSEGWARADQIASHVVLAVVTAGEAPLFARPADSAATGASLPRLTLLAIDIETAGTSFLKVTAYDTTAKMFLKDVYIKNEGTSSRFMDIEPAILLRLAASSRNATQRKAFLSSGIKDFPDSVFVEDLKAAASAQSAPPDTANPASDAAPPADTTPAPP
jgi:hypothetical protein